MKKILSIVMLALASLQANAQCDSIQIPSDYSLSSDLIMSGTYVINGTFTVQAGVTVTITSHETNGCGELKIYAKDIVVEGTIDGSYAGYVGGDGGVRGALVSSATGHESSLSSCNDPGNTGNISVEGGFGGVNGTGPGMGLAGADGDDGSGSKQYCGNTQDEAGVIGGAGGSGGGAGGSYGGVAGSGGDGGAGSVSTVTDNLPIEGTYPVVGGNGGNGGSTSPVYGTATERDIDLGSGGAGSGAGGRSFYLGTNGSAGGTGGGMVFLKADSSIVVSGTILVFGEDGGDGGNGGGGDATLDCCSDACNGCDERTFSTGAGAGSGAGGGSGGGIFIESTGSADITGNLVAYGGAGGDAGIGGDGINCIYEDFFCGDQSITTGGGNDGAAGGGGSGGRVKIYVADCADANINPTVDIGGGTGFGTSGQGTYEEVCGYVGLNEGEISIGWTIFPNPANEFVAISIHSGYDFASNGTVEIFNALGQVVISEQVLNPTMKLSISDLNSGVYTVRITTDSSTEIKKLMKR
ncbi:MAG: T9SS type A sorting domain-containing protein [Crocinitomicaceae bacterium]|nr:T9SS type A sorting domain-containing protein [Crocinitomicaceae bacterium]